NIGRRLLRKSGRNQSRHGGQAQNKSHNYGPLSLSNPYPESALARVGWPRIALGSNRSASATDCAVESTAPAMSPFYAVFMHGMCVQAAALWAGRRIPMMAAESIWE